MMKNPVGYFEIPVQDLDRAIRFYEGEFGYVAEFEDSEGNRIALHSR
jgi:uncharacterized protein